MAYSSWQLARLEEARRALAVQMADKPRRLEHSLSVARTAEELAARYGVDPFDACVAGTLHDWCKALPEARQLELCEELGIGFGVPLAMVAPLVHGPVAARLLPGRFDWIEPQVTQAIERHTIGAADMTPLDMVVFVADYVEPLRPDTPAIQRTRSLVGNAPLGEVCLDACVGSIAFVLETRRYLYPGTLDTYNALLAEREKGTGDAWL